MYKSLLILALCFLAYLGTTYARPNVISILQFPDDMNLDDSGEDDTEERMNSEKRKALETNEIRPDAPVNLETTEDAPTYPEMIKEYDDMSQVVPAPTPTANSASPQSTKLINQSKAPSSIFEYVMEFLYGFGHWLYNKFVS